MTPEEQAAADEAASKAAAEGKGEGTTIPTDEEIAAARAQRAGVEDAPSIEREAPIKNDDIEKTRKSLLADYTRKQQANADMARRLAAREKELEDALNDPDYLELRARRARGGAAQIPADIDSLPISQAIPHLLNPALERIRQESQAASQQLAKELRFLQVGREIEMAKSKYGDFEAHIDAIDAVMERVPQMTVEDAYLHVKGRLSIEEAAKEHDRREQAKLSIARQSRAVPPKQSGVAQGKPSGQVRSFLDAVRLGKADREAAQT